MSADDSCARVPSPLLLLPLLLRPTSRARLPLTSESRAMKLRARINDPAKMIVLSSES